MSEKNITCNLLAPMTSMLVSSHFLARGDTLDVLLYVS
jgi:hypothetical protein